MRYVFNVIAPVGRQNDTIQYSLFLSVHVHGIMRYMQAYLTIIEAYKSDCFYNNHNVDFIYISIQEYEVVRGQRLT